MTARDLRYEAYTILDSSSDFEAICLISEACNILSIDNPGHVRSQIASWDDDLGPLSRESFVEAMHDFARGRQRERISR